MSEIMRIYKTLRRSKILIQAARIAGASYRRDTDLKRLLRLTRLPSPAGGMAHLLTLEEELETIRKCGNSTYSITRHVEVLAALIVEASHLAKPRLV